MRLFSFLLFPLFISCQNSSNSLTQSPFEVYPAKPDTMFHLKWWKDAVIQKSKLFNLPILLSGTDSFELRVWSWHAFDPTVKVLVFKADSLGWSGFNYNSYSETVLSNDGDSLYAPDPKKIGNNIFLCKRLIPKSGWRSFNDSLNRSEMKTLPTEEDIKNYKPKAFRDGYGYVFEIATKHSYRILSYNLPTYCDQRECKKIIAFLDFLKREFGLDYCWPNCWKVGEPAPLAPN